MKKPRNVPIGAIRDKDKKSLFAMWESYFEPGKYPFFNHHHLTFEILIVKSGSGTFVTKNAEYRLSPGDMFIFSCNEEHFVSEIAECGLCTTILQFYPSFFQNSYTSLGGESVALEGNVFFQHSSDFKNRIAAEDTVRLVPIISAIRKELENCEYKYEFFIQSLISQFLINLIRYYGYSADKQSLNSEQEEIIRCSIAYIDEHFDTKVTLQDLSAITSVTSNYLCYLFKKAHGITIFEYINMKRIEKAIDLLTKSSCSSIIDIAFACGYNSTANFNKIFKKCTGMTPSKYREDKHLFFN